jgi:hypothetical protein
MEEWFHNSNNKVEVINARPLIAKIFNHCNIFSNKYKHEWIQSSKLAWNN